MNATPEGRAAAKALILEVRRAGFTQLRKTNDGWLYGSGTYRFLVPYAVGQGSTTLAYVGELLERFRSVRGQRDAEYGRPRPETGLTEPVTNPDDLLHEPEPITETERSVPDAFISVADEGSTPSGLPPTNIAPTEGETTMATRNRRGTGVGRGRPGKPSTTPHQDQACSKCGKVFNWPAARGRHESLCKGKPSDTSTIATRKAVNRILKVKAIPPSNGSGPTIEKFEQALSILGDMLGYVRALRNDMAIISRENDELRVFKQRASALFEASPKVPRA